VPATGSRPTDQKLASGTRWPRNPSPSAEDRPTRIIWARVGRGRGAGEGGQGIWREGGEKRMESEGVRRERASAGVGARVSQGSQIRRFLMKFDKIRRNSMKYDGICPV
jgi:hypothetical protein